MVICISWDTFEGHNIGLLLDVYKLHFNVAL